MGNLHVGHWYNFGPADTIARYNKMLGKDVLHPFGYDSFGLPAENAAIKNDMPPASWTRQNIASMTKQVEAIGTMYDWDKLISTSDPDYYKWTQWIFLKLYDNGLAHKKPGKVNWCPKDQTVLANEQVIGDNNECERCGTAVEQKDLEQWYFKITDYAKQLLDGLDDIDWPGRVKTMQENWIGRSSGAQITFAVADSDKTFDVFTTRHDTQFGVTFVVISSEHNLVSDLTTAEHKKAVEKYVDEASRKTELERQQDEKKKTGVFTGSYAINPANGEKIPIWVADYVLMGYGTGIVMGVPGHDMRDREFAEKFDLDIKQVYKVEEGEPYNTEGEVINSGKYNGMRTAEMREIYLNDAIEAGYGAEDVNYRLRDWLVSRQRYWGAPIPIIYCDDCGTVPVPEDQLPVLLPEDVKFKPTGESPLKSDDNFVNTSCPRCDKPAKRETDTLDTFVDSSWYFLRYPNTKFSDGAFDPEALKKWMPVDHYIGGIEHAILHLLYARFITRALHDFAGLPFQEPFKKLSNQGIILGPDGLKMSKSKGNVVDPDDQVASYGADSLRLYLMFMGPYEQGGPYDFGGIAGVRRFIERVWDLVASFCEEEGDNQDPDKAELATSLDVITHKTIKKVTNDLESMSFNTAVAAMMEMTNELNKTRSELPFASAKTDWGTTLGTLVTLLAPFIPYAAEEMWEMLGEQNSIHTRPWPIWDEQLTIDNVLTVAIQINGKVRDEINITRNEDEDTVVARAKVSPNTEKYLKEKQLVRTIYVPNKLLNFVVK